MGARSTSAQYSTRNLTAYQRYLVSHQGIAVIACAASIAGLFAFAALQADLPNRTFSTALRDAPGLTVAWALIALAVFGPLCVVLVGLVPRGSSQVPPFATAPSAARWGRAAFVEGWGYAGTVSSVLVGMAARWFMSANTADLSDTIPASSAPQPINAYHDPAAFVPLALAPCGLPAGAILGVRRSR